MSFETLGLSPALLSALRDEGFTTPTSVQAAAIPQALAGRDLMVSSQTGSGKTAAFMLPALEHISHRSSQGGRGVQVLVLTPTRELALQIAEAATSYGRHVEGLRVATVVGGMPYGAQIKALGRRVDILVATPGRLIDHMQAKRVNLSTVHTLILDEADRMLDMGFIEDIESIVARVGADHQTLLFSATLDGTVAKLATGMMRDPQRIEISHAHQGGNTNITQHLLYADDKSHKLRLLDHLLRDADLNQAIVFTATKRGADELADHLSEDGFAAAALHGDMNQRQRTRTLGLLQNGRVRVLVATDVAARGIDVQTISHVFNYDLPMQAEDYVHRIGRTGRAGRHGDAITLAVHSERHKVRRIEHFVGKAIPTETVPGMEPTRSARPTYQDRPKKAGRPHSGKPQGKPWQKTGGYAANKSTGTGNPWHKDAPSGDSAGRPARKPWQQDKPTGNYAARGDRSARSEFGARSERPARGEYAGRGDRADRPAGNGRAERSSQGASERPPFAARPTKVGAKSAFKRETRHSTSKSTHRPHFA